MIESSSNPFAVGAAKRRRRRLSPEYWERYARRCLDELRADADAAIEAAETRAAAALAAARESAVADLVNVLPEGALVIVVPPKGVR